MWKLLNEVATIIHCPDFQENNVILNLMLLQEWSNPPNTDFTMIHQMATIMTLFSSWGKAKQFNNPNQHHTLVNWQIIFSEQSAPFLDHFWRLDSAELSGREPKQQYEMGIIWTPQMCVQSFLWKSKESQYVFPKSSKCHLLPLCYCLFMAAKIEQMEFIQSQTSDRWSAFVDKSSLETI